MKHKWHDEIVAWAGGAEIEARNNYRKMCWTLDTQPFLRWENDEYEFRIKPTPKEPQYLKFNIRKHGFDIDPTDLYAAGIEGSFKIKLEVDDD